MNKLFLILIAFSLIGCAGGQIPDDATSAATAYAVGHFSGYGIIKYSPNEIDKVEATYKQAKEQGNVAAFNMLITMVASSMQLNPHHVGMIQALVRAFGGQYIGGEIIDIGTIPDNVLRELEAGWANGKMAAVWERERGI